MRQIGREDELENINRIALKMAREVADETGTLMAGGVCNTNIYVEGDKENHAKIRAMFEEQVSPLGTLYEHVHITRTIIP
jgi:methionine synthase I (cobalamin-dependent)